MSDIYTQMGFIERACSGMPKYRAIKGGKFEFACPFCGDSKSSKRPKAGFFQSNNSGNYVFHCHKCGETRSLPSFLGYVDGQLRNEYLATVGKNNLKRKEIGSKGYAFTPKYKKRVTPHDDGGLLRNNPKSGITLKSLRQSTRPLNKMAVEYMEHRGVEYEYARRTDDLAAFYEMWSGKKAPISPGSCGIVLPCLNDYGKCMGFVARNLDAGPDDLRYVAYCGVDGLKLIFGTDRITDRKRFYVAEGSFDALSIQNCVAVLNADLHKTIETTLKREVHDAAVMLHDNEPHHPVIAKKLLDSIEAGYAVVIFPRDWPKDLNDMVLKHGRQKVMRYIENNIVQGPAAKFRWMRWQKIVA